MKLEQSFTVEAPVERVWAALIDVERIAPCLPGAEITGVDDTGAYQGSSASSSGRRPRRTAGRCGWRRSTRPRARATMSAKGTDKRGQGGASATIVSTMRDDAGATQVDVLTDFHITGRLARFGRSGMIEDISKRLMRDFAQCLQATIEAGGSAEPEASAGGAAVVSRGRSHGGGVRCRGRGDRVCGRRGGGGRERERGAAGRGEARRRAGRPRSRAAGRPTTARGAPGRPRRGRRGARARRGAGADGVAERLAGRRDGGRGGSGRERVAVAARGAARAGVAFPAARRAAGAGRSGRDGGGAGPDRVDPAPGPARPAGVANREAERRPLVVLLGPRRPDHGAVRSQQDVAAYSRTR